MDGDPLSIEEALAAIELGASIEGLREEFLRRRLGTPEERAFREAWKTLDPSKRADLERGASSFAAGICRLLGERRGGDPRIAAVLREWADRSKDYAAFDALLCHFRFPGRERLLEEGRRLFPSTLTRHWDV